MTAYINGYKIETGFGFSLKDSTVTEIKGHDEYGRLIMGAMVFQGHWNECKKWAETH